ncbi:hypothetical protein KP509_22G026100 [Ceratopteris richardii]|uniref:SAP domain-containing protein n=1 Tax=Ceratopteris richardii TaxID=49495 RepID=A0A8T2S5K0_CERRI|nr:hypothetical protein KP509_22G026100 [Ceratopteris richardii]
MESVLWKANFVLNAVSPLSLDHGLLCVRLRTDLEVDDSSVSADLCRRLDFVSLSLNSQSSGSAKQKSFCVAFRDGVTSVSVVFPASMKMEMKRVLQSIVERFSEIKLICTAPEAFHSGLTMKSALLCGLREALVSAGWIVFDGNLALHGCITEFQNGTLAESIVFDLHTEANDRINFILSPDVIQFRPFRIERLLSGSLEKSFDSGLVLDFEDYLDTLLPADDQTIRCLVLPSMQEGCCRTQPVGFDLEKEKDIWKLMHGITLPNEGFYVRVLIPQEGAMLKSWFPSCLVLKSCGLVPAPLSIRTSRIHSILAKITSSISRWDFFGSESLMIKTLDQEGENSRSACWQTGNSILRQASQLGVKDITLENNINIASIKMGSILNCLRRSKLPSCHYTAAQDTVQGSHISRNSICSSHLESSSTTTSLRAPIFLKRKTRGPQDKVKDHSSSRSESNQKISTTSNTNNIEGQENLLMERCQKIGLKKIAAGNPAALDIQKNMAYKATKRKLISGRQNMAPDLTLGASVRRISKKVSLSAQASTEGLGQLSSDMGIHQHSKSGSSDCLKSTSEKKLIFTSILPQGRSICDFEVSLSSGSSMTGLEQLSPVMTVDHHSKQGVVNCMRSLPDKLTSSDKLAVRQLAPEPKENYAGKGTTPRQKKLYGERKSASTATIDSVSNRQRISNKHAEGKLSELTIPELKLFLSENKAKVSGKKDELIQRVTLLLSSLKSAY